MIVELIPMLQGVLERGLIFSLPVVALYLSSRVIHFDDLTLEGSFGIGSAVTAVCLSQNVPWPIVIVLSALSGGLCGIITGLLHTTLGINKLISGIITTTGAFSVSLVLAGSFLSLSKSSTIFGFLPAQLGQIHALLILASLSLATILLIFWLLKTQVGFLLRALGNNPMMLTLIGKDKSMYLILCLFISNALTAISGSLFVQYTGYFSLWTQVGMLIFALAGLMISSMFFTAFGVTILVGPLLYQLLASLTFELQFDPAWNKLITAFLMIALFALQRVTKLGAAKC